MKKIYVKPSEELEGYRPSASPARVEIQTGKQSYSLEMLHPKGHPSNRFSWEEVIDKFRWVTKPILGEGKANQLAHLIRKLDDGINLTSLLELLTERHA